MKPLSEKLINRLDLAAALDQERETVRNLLPTEPGLERLVDNAAKFCEWLVGQLRSGMDIAPNHVVSARKYGVGTRPVPIVGIAGRVLYRALTEELLRDRASVDRTPGAYLEFVAAPIIYARELGGTDWTIRQSDITHVVKTDLAAFYEYVDHAVLMSELLDVSPDFDAIEALRELLNEMEGRTFGLPQLLDPSDELSDLYADIVERGLLREGLQVWRFNDDFRMACASYSEALRAIEALGRHARHLGLVISEHKTFTPTFRNYAFSTLGLEVEDTIPEDTESEDAEGDYVAVDTETRVADALATLSSLAEPGGEVTEGKIALTSLDSEDFGRLRRAVRTLKREGDPGGLDHVLALMIYAPALTPLLAEYLQTVPEGAADVIDPVIERVSLSDWQALWLVRLLRVLGLLDGEGAVGRVKWLRGSCLGRVDPALRAEAFWALADQGKASFEELEFHLRSEPEVLSPWYLEAIAALAESSTPPSLKMVEAVRNSHPLFGLILNST